MFFKPQIDFLVSFDSTNPHFSWWHFDESDRAGIPKDLYNGDYQDEFLMLICWDGISG